jgi:RNA polymerase sigma factor (sigma-70 family)
MEPTDSELITACRRQDSQAWEILVNRYQRMVYTIPRRAGLSEDGAADVFQRVFTILVERIDRIEQPERIAAWLATTARRETWRISKRERSTQSFGQSGDDDEAVFDPEDPSALPDELVEQIEQQQLVRIAFQELDERCQQLLTVLFYEHEPPSYADLAQSLGISEGSIGPTRARCLQKLRKLLDDRGF